MRRTVAMMVAAAVGFGGLLAGCTAPGAGATPAGRGGVRGDVLTYADGDGGWVYYEEGDGPQATRRGIGGVRAVTFGPLFVAARTDQGTYVIPRERFVLAAPTGGPQASTGPAGHGD